MKALKFNQFVNEQFANGNDSYGTYFASLLGLRDQAHIFHWQTESFARHQAFGDFYTAFLAATDVLAEMIMGIKGRPVLGGPATINLVDYSDAAVETFIEDSYSLLGEELKAICDEVEHEEVFDQARVILAEVDKLKYLLTLD